jgi:hypothetical protein
LKEEKIKSALEIAMEKVSGLPELTREEIEEQKEKEYGPVGEALAKKYLSGTISDGEISHELDRHTGAEGNIVRRALVAGLCREIRLENEREIGEKVLRGLKQLASEKDKEIKRIGDEYRETVEEFIKKKEKESRQFEILAMERFGKLGIAGSAVRLNLNEDANWKEQLYKLQNVYEPRLTDIRNRLMEEIQ